MPNETAILQRQIIAYYDHLIAGLEQIKIRVSPDIIQQWLDLYNRFKVSSYNRDVKEQRVQLLAQMKELTALQDPTRIHLRKSEQLGFQEQVKALIQFYVQYLNIQYLDTVKSN